MRPFTLYTWLVLAVIPAAIISVAGCIVGNYASDDQLDTDYIEEIQKGITTKQEILDRLGLPKILARKGKTVKVPSNDPEKDMEEVDSELLFELFSAKHAIGDHHIVYFYYSSNMHMAVVMPILPIASASGSMDIDRLWILIDQNTGIVEDYLFRSSP